MVECETRTQGAGIAALFPRLRTRDRADQRGRAARASFRNEFSVGDGRNSHRLRELARVRHREIYRRGADGGSTRGEPPRQPHRRLRAPDDLDLLPRERARDAEPERLADRLLAGEATRVALRRVRPRVAVRALGLGETALAEPLVARERTPDPLDLDQVGADTDAGHT